jgi:mono/diheme cytochrome c family protein
MMIPKSLACCLVLGSALLAAPLFAKQNQSPPRHAAHRPTQPAVSSRSQDNEQEGERVFEQNCARCHNAPDGFSSRITGTIVRHMRVRANLSKHDEELLLHFFNP